MCKVPVKEEIRTKQDVYFLVGSIINRQIGSFSPDEILSIAKSNLRGSEVKLSDSDLQLIIDHELDILYRNSFVKMSGRSYVNNDNFAFA